MCHCKWNWDDSECDFWNNRLKHLFAIIIGIFFLDFCVPSHRTFSSDVNYICILPVRIFLNVKRSTAGQISNVEKKREFSIYHHTLIWFYEYDLTREAFRNRRQSVIRGRREGLHFGIYNLGIYSPSACRSYNPGCESGYDPVRIGSDISGRNVARATARGIHRERSSHIRFSRCKIISKRRKEHI